MPRSRRNQPSPAKAEPASPPPPAAPPPPPAPPTPPRPADAVPAAGPAYGVSFDLVWRAALQVIRDTDRWSVVESDPVRGEIVAEIRPLLRGTPRPARIVVSLDELGLTRVDASLHGDGRAPGTAPSRPIAGFYRRLERLLTRGA